MCEFEKFFIIVISVKNKAVYKIRISLFISQNIRNVNINTHIFLPVL